MPAEALLLTVALIGSQLEGPSPQSARDMPSLDVPFHSLLISPAATSAGGCHALRCVCSRLSLTRLSASRASPLPVEVMVWRA